MGKPIKLQRKERNKKTNLIPENNPKTVAMNNTDLEEKVRNNECGSTLDHFTSSESTPDNNVCKNSASLGKNAKKAKLLKTVRTPVTERGVTYLIKSFDKTLCCRSEHF